MKDNDWKVVFLKALALNGNITRSALSAHVSRAEVYRERAESTDFAQAWDDALESAGDLLEEEARRRAYKGTLKPVFHQGEKCGEIREYSDTLMIFLLKGAKPKKYRENARIEHTGADGTAITVQSEIADLRQLPADELVRLYREKVGGD